MSKHGAELGGDLYDLWRSATTSIPQLAGYFESAAGSFEPTSSEMAFMRGGDLGESAFGPYGAVRDCYSVLEECVQQTATNLHKVGHALSVVVKDYATRDAEARAEFERLGGHL
jgi:hypothetical protein